MTVVTVEVQATADSESVSSIAAIVDSARNRTHDGCVWHRTKKMINRKKKKKVKADGLVGSLSCAWRCLVLSLHWSLFEGFWRNEHSSLWRPLPATCRTRQDNSRLATRSRTPRSKAKTYTKTLVEKVTGMLQENTVPGAFWQASSHTPSICLCKRSNIDLVSHFSVDRESEKL